MHNAVGQWAVSYSNHSTMFSQQELRRQPCESARQDTRVVHTWPSLNKLKPSLSHDKVRLGSTPDTHHTAEPPHTHNS